MIDLSIIIVNWNSANYIRKCISSIYEHTRGINFEIVVVDNASYDECESILKKEFPEVIFIQSEKNLGFAKANNLGFQNSSGKNILFLNPDTELIGPAIKVLFHYQESIPDAGAVGGKLLNTDLSIQTSCIQSFPTILNQTLDIDIFKLRFPKLRLWGGFQALFLNNSTPAVVEAISGACIMIKREIFEKIGLFNTDYFMFAEDIDLCYKVWQAGYKIYFINDAQIIHHGGGSTKKHNINYLNIVLMRESIFRFLQTYKGTSTAQLYRVSTIFTSLMRMMLTGLLISIYHKDDRVNSLCLAFNKWRKIMRWSLGLERWVHTLNNKHHLLP